MVTSRSVAAAMLVAACFARPAAGASLPAFTLDTVYAKVPPWGRTIDRVSWSPDGKRFLYVQRSQDPREVLAVLLYDVGAGQSRMWAKPGQFGGLPDTPVIKGWSPDGRQVAILVGADLYAVPIAGASKARKIAADVDDVEWSPRGSALAYAHAADLYVARLGRRVETARITWGGVPGQSLNGTLDWVYPEELGIDRGFQWSPDGRSLAYLHFDERPVTDFPIVDFLTLENAVSRERYPLAGGRNPKVRLRIVTAGAARVDRLVYDAGSRDEYVAAFGWIAHTHSLQAEILDRAQRDMRVDLFRTGAPTTTLYRQRSSSWVDVEPLPTWLSGGRSVWLLDRDTTAGVYLRLAGGSLKRLTAPYRVFDPLNVAPNGTTYAVAAYPTRRDRSLLAISLTGAVRNLTPIPGWHTVAMAPSLDRFVDTHSRLNDPPDVRLVTTVALAAKTLVSESGALAKQLLPTAMLTVPSPYGPLDATLLRPPDFHPTMKYPVVIEVYGGPDAPTTGDRFGGLYSQLLAEQGTIVFSIDGPASQVDNDGHVRLLLHNFGPGSLLGQEIGARFLASLPYVDASRIGIWGWSFGGYETCYALTHDALFKAGAAVAPVTDWHLYDSIYTERYMGMPQRNGPAYARSSVLEAAAHLNGPLLIQHGTSDDNVHMANTMQLLQRFILSRESRVTFYAYPRKTHSISGLAQQRSVFAHMLDFWKANL